MTMERTESIPTGRSPSGAAKPVIKKFRPKASPAPSAAEEAAGAAQAAGSGPTATDGCASLDGHTSAGAAQRPLATNLTDGIQKLADEAEQAGNPLTGLLVAVSANLCAAMQTVAASAKKACSALPDDSLEAVKISFLSADKQSAVAKHLYNYLHFYERVNRQRLCEPLRFPADRSSAGDSAPRG